jgi:hypothetical protein
MNDVIERADLGIRLSDPVVVALSAPGETRWGFHQFPAISRLPDGRLLVTYNDRADRDDAYGTPGPAFVSVDDGETWMSWQPPDDLLAVSHTVISPVYDGEFLCAPIAPSLGIAAEQIELPALAGTMNVYGEVLFYRASDCAPDVRQYLGRLPATRWSPTTGCWQRETLSWDTTRALVRTRKNDYVIPRPFLDNALLKFDGKLYYPDFHLQHQLADGSVPKNYVCWCMISADNGRTWQRHGRIAYDASGEVMMGEPCLLPTAAGRLACVIRCSDHTQRPMLICFSDDAGRSWSATEPLAEFGVMPQAVLLENGIAALAYGRPGVHLRFAADGSARNWTAPLTLVGAQSVQPTADSCGYTRLLQVAPDAFLIAYSDFRYSTPAGDDCKAILVRRVQVRLR